MSGNLVKKLNLTPKEKKSLGKTLGQIKTVNEFFSDVLKAGKGVNFVEAICEALPWTGIVAEALSDAVPPVRFVVKLFEKLNAVPDPEGLAYLACTIAYQRSVEHAVLALENAKESKNEDGQKGRLQSLQDLEQKLAELEEADTAQHYDFRKFSLGHALHHEFIQDADRVLLVCAEASGYSEAEQRQLQNEVHQRFRIHFKTLLEHGESRTKFAPLKGWLTQEVAEDALIHEALAEHAEYQRQLFQEKPVFGHEPFALAHVYQETQCGILKWGQIDKNSSKKPGRVARPEPEIEFEAAERIDAFQEKHGGRHSLQQTVLDLLGDPQCKEPIIIQGVAGSGKSAFTLWLSTELVKQGLIPIRVLLKDLRLERVRPITEILAESLRLPELDDLSQADPFVQYQGLDYFQEGDLFQASKVRFGQAWISPYVLILDGWDEITLGTSDDFKRQLERILQQVRTEFLHNRRVLVRVLLTGRPSTELSDIPFLRQDTPILTLRPLSPQHLESLIQRMSDCSQNPPLEAAEDMKWQPFPTQLFVSVLEQYQKAFELWCSGKSSSDSKTRSLEVLGLPLLAHLAIRLFAKSPEDIDRLVNDPTQLYQNLVRLTCGKAGKYVQTDEELDNPPHLKGTTLHQLLHQTAVAMTVCGQENISYQELSLRLDYTETTLDHKVGQATHDSPLSQLMISYYFKGGHPDLGCEFLHKSFREYLFAEAVVERLKRYGSEQQDVLPERMPYWKDFDESDPRYSLIRDLAPMLAPQWLTPEVVNHLGTLLLLEIQEAAQTPNTSLDMKSWEHIRDALADLWDWWAEGVHLRPQPFTNKRKVLEFDPPLTQELIEGAIPQDWSKGDPLPPPPRFTTMDAHLGDALFRLCAWVHGYVAVAQGWKAPLSREGEHDPDGSRRYQSWFVQEQQTWVLFAPSGNSREYFQNYVNRINSGGWRPSGLFPAGAYLIGAYLSDADLRGADLRGADLSGAYLRGADLSGAYLRGADLRGADLIGADLSGADLSGADLSGADLRGAYLIGAYLSGADLRGAYLRGADLSGAYLIGAYLSDADLRRANYQDARISKAQLKQAVLE